MDLPLDFVLEMKNLLGEDEYEDYEKSFLKKSKIGIRVNRRKISVEKFKEIFPFELKKVPYTDNGFYIDDADAASKHPYYFAGLYYIQEPSAMLPAASMEIDEDSYVLDLCASPGGKATELLSKNPKLLIANDISYSRCIALTKNLELFGGGQICVTAETPERLSFVYPQFFDKILVDAPCSGEGMFRKDAALIASWDKKRPSDYADTQYKILSEAVKMLKEGGCIIYSTCTFSMLEDEKVIGRVLMEHPELHLDKIPEFEGASTGFFVEEYSDIDFSNCIRLFPHKFDGEGHFVARIRKENTGCNDNQISHNIENISNVVSYNKLPEEVKLFLSHTSKIGEEDIFYLKDNFLYLLNREIKSSMKNNLRYSRTGVMIGEIKKSGHFIVNNAFALFIDNSDFDNVLNISSDNPDVIRYLKGETLIIESVCENVKKGYVLVCVDGYPLGFAKYDGMKFKNLYTPGWRYNGN